MSKAFPQPTEVCGEHAGQPESALILCGPGRPRVPGEAERIHGAGSSALVGTHLSAPPSSFDPPTESGAGTAEAKPLRCNYFNSARCWELVSFPRMYSRERQDSAKDGPEKGAGGAREGAPVLEQLESRKPLPSIPGCSREGEGEGQRGCLIGIPFRLLTNPRKLDQITAPSVL